ncbi:hypothetical protein HK100_004299 [Physocladia obscura]|uniref:non-specific serine/threonine protein kinase n=1 Tax=Physocladia obscura TaxID=109957 RepID=A0AAD5T909_9FUNG|nr:hypothetical protein HK100_004299 [Physocladia obscura]
MSSSSNEEVEREGSESEIEMHSPIIIATPDEGDGFPANFKQRSYSQSLKRNMMATGKSTSAFSGMSVRSGSAGGRSLSLSISELDASGIGNALSTRQSRSSNNIIDNGSGEAETNSVETSSTNLVTGTRHVLRRWPSEHESPPPQTIQSTTSTSLSTNWFSESFSWTLPPQVQAPTATAVVTAVAPITTDFDLLPPSATSNHQPPPILQTVANTTAIDTHSNNHNYQQSVAVAMASNKAAPESTSGSPVMPAIIPPSSSSSSRTTFAASQQRTSGSSINGIGRERVVRSRLLVEEGGSSGDSDYVVEDAVSASATSTSFQATINSSNVMLGMGLLTLPYALHVAGWVPGILMLTIFAFTAQFTAKLLGKCMVNQFPQIGFESTEQTPLLNPHRHRAAASSPLVARQPTSLSDVVELAFGPRARPFISFLFMVELFAAATGLILLGADSIIALVPADVVDVLPVKVGVTALLVLTTLPRGMGWLAYGSVLGLLTLAALFLILVFDGVVTPTTPGSIWVPAETNLWPVETSAFGEVKSMWLAAGLFVVGLDAHAVFPGIYRDLKVKKEFGGVVQRAYFMNWTFYLSFSAVGFIMFGKDVLPQITQNFPAIPTFNASLTRFIVVLTALNPFTKYALIMAPVNHQMEQILNLAGPKSASQPFCNASGVLLRVGLGFLAVLTTIVFPSFHTLMGLVGSLFSFLIVGVIPAVCYLRLGTGSGWMQEGIVDGCRASVWEISGCLLIVYHIMDFDISGTVEFPQHQIISKQHSNFANEEIIESNETLPFSSNNEYEWQNDHQTDFSVHKKSSKHSENNSHQNQVAKDCATDSGDRFYSACSSLSPSGSSCRISTTIKPSKTVVAAEIKTQPSVPRNNCAGYIDYSEESESNSVTNRKDRQFDITSRKLPQKFDSIQNIRRRTQSFQDGNSLAATASAQREWIERVHHEENDYSVEAVSQHYVALDSGLVALDASSKIEANLIQSLFTLKFSSDHKLNTVLKLIDAKLHKNLEIKSHRESALKRSHSCPDLMISNQDVIINSLKEVIMEALNISVDEFIGTAAAKIILLKFQKLQLNACNNIIDLVDKANKFLTYMDLVYAKLESIVQLKYGSRKSKVKKTQAKLASLPNLIAKKLTCEKNAENETHRPNSNPNAYSHGSQTLEIQKISGRLSTNPSPLSSAYTLSTVLNSNSMDMEFKGDGEVENELKPNKDLPSPRAFTPKRKSYGFVASASDVSLKSSTSFDGESKTPISRKSRVQSPLLEKNASTLANDVPRNSIALPPKSRESVSNFDSLRTSILGTSTSGIFEDLNENSPATGESLSASNRTSSVHYPLIEDLKNDSSSTLERASSPKNKKKPVLAFLKMIFNNSANVSSASSVVNSDGVIPVQNFSPVVSTTTSQIRESKQRSLTGTSQNSVSSNILGSSLQNLAATFEKSDSQLEKLSFEEDLTAITASGSMVLATQVLQQKTLCRICEEEVATEAMEVHVKLCSITHEFHLQEYNYDQKLKKLLANFSSRKTGLSMEGNDGARLRRVFENFEDQTKILLHFNDDREKKSAIQFIEKTIAKIKKILQEENSVKSKADIFELGKKLLNLAEEKLDCLVKYQQAMSLVNPAAKAMQEAAEAVENLTAMISPKTSHKMKSTKRSLDLEIQNVGVEDMGTIGSGKGKKFMNLFTALLKGNKKQLFPNPLIQTETVYLAKKSATQDLFAIKILKKDDMIRKNMMSQVRAEHKALTLSRNPFVVKLFYAFQSKEYLYLVMEYLIGGDLSTLLTAFVTFDTSMTRMYCTEVVLALEYLHLNGIIHRDLKPDNMLITKDGHVKLTDFGLSCVASEDQISKAGVVKNELMRNTESPASVRRKIVDTHQRRMSISVLKKESSKNLMGTPDYLAPELLLGLEHSSAVDWWSLGICTYEWLNGFPPFTDDTPEAIFKNILNQEIVWSEEEPIDEDAKDLILQLLNSDPVTRARAPGIKQHRFFSETDWDHILDHPAGFIPAPNDGTDTSYFEGRNTRPDIQRLSGLNVALNTDFARLALQKNAINETIEEESGTRNDASDDLKCVTEQFISSVSNQGDTDSDSDYNSSKNIFKQELQLGYGNKKAYAILGKPFNVSQISGRTRQISNASINSTFFGEFTFKNVTDLADLSGSNSSLAYTNEPSQLAIESVMSDSAMTVDTPPKADKASKIAKALAGGKAKKKKWSKGRTKDKANNAVIFDKLTFDKLFKEVPTYKLITPSVLVDRLKINGSLARVAIRDLASKGLIKPVVVSKKQLIYTRATVDEASAPAAVAVATEKKAKVSKKKAAVEEDEEDDE